jgi:putative oxidoreductase
VKDLYPANYHFSINFQLLAFMPVNNKKAYMRNLFTTWYSDFFLNVWLVFLRLGVSGFMLTHGIPKLQKLMRGDMEFPDPIGLGPAFSLILTTFAEAFCSVLILLGLATRLATIPLIITMLVAVFVIHADDPFVRQEMGLLYLLIYLTLLVIGPGKYSVDRMISNPLNT